MKKFIIFCLMGVMIINTPVVAEIEKKVKVSSNDTTSGFLNGKLVPGSNITFTENNDGGNESLQINSTGGGGGGSSIVLDLNDDSVNESTSLTEIATINDTYSVFTNPTSDKLRVDLSQKWPLSHQSVSLQANGSNCSAGNSPLGVDASGASEGCFDVEEEGQISTTVVSGNASDDTLLNGTGSNTASWASIPNCIDSAGNHLNYTASTNSFSCGTTGGGSGYATIQDEGSSLTSRSIVNFIGSGISCVDDGSTKTNCTVTTGTTSAYDQLQEEGSNVTQRSTLNFIGSAFTLADNGTKSQLTMDSDVNAIADLASSGIVTRTGSGTMTVRSLVAPAAGITISNNDGVSGDPTFALANDLAAVEGLSSTGLAIRTAANTWTNRSIAGTSNEITITNGDGVSGDPTVSIPSTFDLSGKTTFKIPTGTAPTVNTAGTIAEDTTASQLLYGAAPNVLSPNKQACVTLTDVTNTDDNTQFFVADRDITVTKVGCRYEGTGTTVATFSLENSKTGTAMTHTAPTCSTGNNNASFQSVTANNSIVSGDGIRFDTTNTPSPTTDDYTICITYTEDRK